MGVSCGALAYNLKILTHGGVAGATRAIAETRRRYWYKNMSTVAGSSCIAVTKSGERECNFAEMAVVQRAGEALL